MRFIWSRAVKYTSNLVCSTHSVDVLNFVFSIWLAACGGCGDGAVVVAATAEGRAEVIKSIGDHQVSTSHTHQNRHVLNWTNTHNQPLIINGSNMTWRFQSLFFRSFFDFVSLVLAPVASSQRRGWVHTHTVHVRRLHHSTLRICLMNIHFRWFNQNQSKSNRIRERWWDETKRIEIELIFYLLSLKWFHQHITIQKKCILFCG